MQVCDVHTFRSRYIKIRGGQLAGIASLLLLCEFWNQAQVHHVWWHQPLPAEQCNWPPSTVT